MKRTPGEQRDPAKAEEADGGGEALLRLIRSILDDQERCEQESADDSPCRPFESPGERDRICEVRRLLGYPDPELNIPCLGGKEPEKGPGGPGRR